VNSRLPARERLRMLWPSVSIYRTEISSRDIVKIRRNRTHTGGCRGPEPEWRAGVRRAWAAVPNADARLRAEQAAEHAARHVPGALLRHAVPLPEQAVRRGPDRQGRRRARPGAPSARRAGLAQASPRERSPARQVED